MAAWPVVLAMNVDDYKCARKIRKVIGNVRGVESVSSSPEQGLVVVHGTADAWALRRRIWSKMKRRAEVVSDGSAPYNYQGQTAAPHYYQGSSQYDYYAHPQAPQYGYYSHPQQPPHGYYSHPPPPQHGYPYGGGGYDGWAADPDPYGYEAYSTVCSIM